MTEPAAPRGRRAWLRRVALALVVVLGGIPLALVLLYRVVPPPITPLMVIRLVQGEGLDKDWVAFSDIAETVPRAVIAAEDNSFCQHHGFDWQAIQDAIEENQEGGRLRGASTISMQTAKNLFLWPGRSYLRKIIEAYLTSYIELLWPKRRILEVYLNVVEWSAGVYGIEAAARHAFNKPAKQVTAWEAALLASALPNPRERSAGAPSAYMLRTARTITRRVGQIRPLLDCY